MFFSENVPLINNIKLQAITKEVIYLQILSFSDLSSNKTISPDVETPPPIPAPRKVNNK
jgi:hypothetical protein